MKHSPNHAVASISYYITVHLISAQLRHSSADIKIITDGTDKTASVPSVIVLILIVN